MRVVRNVAFLTMLCVILATGSITRAYDYYNGPCPFDGNCDCFINTPENGGEQGQMWYSCHYQECGLNCADVSNYCRQLCEIGGAAGVMSYLCDPVGCYGDCTCYPIPLK